MNLNLNQQDNAFLQKSKHYADLSWSVIPVWGVEKPERFKVATCSWTPFMSHRATAQALYYWFATCQHQGIGIVTGDVSGLAVLDFDNPSAYAEFCKQFPELIQTYIVKTPNGWHLYFYIPADCTTQTQHVPDTLDWQWQGRYVVAPPTAGYCAQNDLSPRQLSQKDIATIERFIDAQKPVFESQPAMRSQSLSQRELQQTYIRTATQGNRNSSLFHTACLARDHGWTVAGTTQALADLHAHNEQGIPEPVNRRYREAVATIKSAFSRPPRPIEELVALPNNIKEDLCQRGLVAMVRVIEGLRQLEVNNGDGICREHVKILLKGIVGEHSIRKTLASGLLECVEAQKNPFPEPHTLAHAATHASNDTITKCSVIRISKPTETPLGGRPTKWFRLPTNAELAEKLDLQPSRIADTLELADITSAKQTRMALHRKYIERRPGQYPTKWLSKRLGVSRVTKNRYDKTLRDLHKRPEYSTKRLYWNTLNEIPDETIPGVFLEDETGKRYPAKRGLAGKLMKEKHTIRLCKQLPNTYWIGSRFDSPQPRPASAGNRAGQAAEETAYAEMWDKAQAEYSTPAASIAQNTPKVTQGDVSTRPATIYQQPAGNEHKPSITDDTRMAHNPNRKFKLDYLESHAETFQTQINQLSTERISLVAVRRLICRYGVTPIRKAIKRVRKRDDIDNPPGFITTLLHSQFVVQRLKSG